MTYIVQADLENRLTAAVLTVILDDDESGAVDAGPLAQVIADAEAYVESWLFPVYDYSVLRSQGTAVNNEVKRLCLDVAISYLWDRHPGYIRADGPALLKRAREDLEEIRLGHRQLSTGLTPEPGANHGGIVRSGDRNDREIAADKQFLDPDSLGIFF